MLGTGVQPICIRRAGAPRDDVSLLAAIQPFAVLLESRSSKIRGGTSLETHRLAAAQSNSFRMKLLYKSQNNFRRDRRPGRIVSGETLLESAHSAENHFQKPAKNKSLRITSLYKRKNNCPGITLLQKRVGVWGMGALLRPLPELGGLIWKRTEYIELAALPAPAVSLGGASIRSIDGKI